MSTRTRLLLFLASFLVALAAWILAPASMKSATSSDYAPQVENLLTRGSFVAPDGDLLARYPPGFPLLLAAVDEAAAATGLPQPWMLALVLAATTALATLLVHALASSVLGPRGALLAGALSSRIPSCWRACCGP